MDTASSPMRPKLTKATRTYAKQGAYSRLTIGGMVIALMFHSAIIGCVTPRKNANDSFNCAASSLAPAYLDIESPKLCDQACESASEFAAGPPPTIRNYQQLEPWQLTLEEAVQLTLSNAKVLNRLGGRVVAGPQGSTTIYDPAIQATNPLSSAEAALSAFDAQYSGAMNHGHDEQFVNNPFFGSGNTYSGNINSQLAKTTAAGTQYSVRSLTNYNRNPSPFFSIPSLWTVDVVAEVRQPLLRNRGAAVNRIAGPNALPGQYNGVLIGRIREDVTLADFEANVRDLVRDVVINYWELYFAYQDLDTKMVAREAARGVWQNRKARLDSGIGRPDDEAQARQQYFQFQFQVDNALVGPSALGRGVFGAERELRRLMGLPTADGRLIRPATEPTLAEVIFDWEAAQQSAMLRRVELRRQKWLVRQRELELCAAKNLALWRVDLVGNYGSRGVGDDLFGSSSIPADGAVQELFGGELDNWQFGLDIQGPVGNRRGHLAVQNAELSLCREKALLREQQRQILHDLGAAYAEVDRTFVSIKSVYNNRDAVQEELAPKRKRVEAGEDDVFFLLDAQQRATTIESGLHRVIVDYNLSLLNFAYQEGNLLSQFNIDLLEEAWSDPAQAAAGNHDRRIFSGELSNTPQHVGPITDGATMRQFALPNSSDVGMPTPVSIDPSGQTIISIPPLEPNQ